MSSIQLTNRHLANIQPKTQPFILRDSSLKGFGIKVNPSGQIKYIAEVWHQGKSVRRTVGEYPLMSIQEARTEALSVIAEIKSGASGATRPNLTLEQLFKKYLADGRLKARTVRDYQEAINFYLEDWLHQPVSAISKGMVEKRFYKIRDRGVNGGRPTYSQATKTMRILSALMNYARADDLIQTNPVEVLKLKRVDRSIRKREHYLKAEEVARLIQATVNDHHPMVLAIHLMLFTGLRKNEALHLRWSDLDSVENVQCLVIKDTKNHRPHYVPITSTIEDILSKAKNHTIYIFPSTQKGNSPICDERPTIQRICKRESFDFRCHDLRRTFATRASEVGIDHMMIKRLLNHKSNDITDQYIQWHSKENLKNMKDALARISYEVQ